MGNTLVDFHSSMNSVRKGALENLRVLGFYGDQKSAVQNTRGFSYADHLNFMSKYYIGFRLIWVLKDWQSDASQMTRFRNTRKLANKFREIVKFTPVIHSVTPSVTCELPVIVTSRLTFSCFQLLTSNSYRMEWMASIRNQMMLLVRSLKFTFRSQIDSEWRTIRQSCAALVCYLNMQAVGLANYVGWIAFERIRWSVASPLDSQPVVAIAPKDRLARCVCLRSGLGSHTQAIYLIARRRIFCSLPCL